LNVQEPDIRGRDLIEMASTKGLVVRSLGGAAVRLACPRVTERGPLRRTLNDLDLATRRVDARGLEAALEEYGLLPEKRFNLLHGEKRLLFVDPVTEKHLDVFIDQFEMCHTLDLGSRLTLFPLTLTPSDLLLTKLQVARMTENDVRDVAALCLETDEPLQSWFDRDYLAHVLGGDWGWWKTVTDNVEVVRESLPAIGLDPVLLRRSDEVLLALREVAQDSPKSRRWKLRARIGTHVPWREDPEDPQR
jgi:hypothetical protein